MFYERKMWTVIGSMLVFLMSSFLYSCGYDEQEVRRAQKNTQNIASDAHDVDDDSGDAVPVPETTPSSIETPLPLPTQPIDTIDDAVKFILQGEIKNDLTFLASTELEGRGTGEVGGDKAAEFIAKKFKEYGLKPAVDNTYFQPFSASGRLTKNVIGILEGNDPILKDQYIVIGAHYDHMGKEGDTIYYGADDNASGTTAVIYAAKALSQIKHNLKRSVVFIGFSGEEMGLLGSYYYVKNTVVPINKTKYMINLDMIGYLDYEGSDLRFLGGKSSKVATAYMENVMAKYSTVKAEITSSAGGGSDHVAFIGADIPSVFMHTGLHPYYHKPSDTPDRINFAGVTNITKMATELLWSIDQGDVEPSMDSYMTLTREEELDHGFTPFMKQ